MGKAHIVETVEISAPIEQVFERLIDHEAMSDWPGVSRCRLIREGSPRNGLGAVREVVGSGLTLHEEVVAYQPPEGYDYKITKGLPVDHLGRVRLAPVEGGVRLTWNISMSSRWPFVCGLVGRGLGRGLPKALAQFKAKTETAAAEMARREVVG
ncbi:MAG: SRPBCC family protein [Candidatus Binatia bacterium]